MKNIAIFYGGRSYEHDISIITAIQVMTYIDSKKYRIIPVYMKDGMLFSLKNPQKFGSYIDFSKAKRFEFADNGLKFGLKKIHIDCALLCTHGGEGENGILQAILEYYRIPHTTSDSSMSAVGMNKLISKAVFNAMNVDTVPGASGDDSEAITKLGYPLIVKPVSLGSSIGIEIAHNKKELTDAILVSKHFDENLLIEKALEKRIELNCAAVKCKDCIIISAIEKPVTWREYLSFTDKYNTSGKERAEKELPAKITAELKEKIENTTRKIYKAMNLFGVVRMDYLYSIDEKKLYINEINTIPGSLSYYLFSEIGLTFTKLIDLLIDEGIGRGIQKNISYTTDILKQYISTGSLLKSSKQK